MTKLFIRIIVVLAVLAVVSCEKNTKKGPSVKTLAPTEVGTRVATLNARIYFSGTSRDGATYGFFWGTSEDAEGTYIPVESELDENNTYSAVIEDLTPETGYWFKASAEIGGQPYTGEIQNFTTAALSYLDFVVDLGIVMTRKDGTKYKIYWATSNLCETGLCPNIEDYGDYYAWGETEPHYSSLDPLTWKDNKTGYSWATYKWCNGTQSTLTKYNTFNSTLGEYDNIGELQRGENEGETTDDVARDKLGGKWRMPTRDEFRALFNNCTAAWETVNGHGGRKLTSNITDYADNWIFLPAAGQMSDESCSYNGKSGHYWSSTLYAIPVYSCMVSFAETYINARDNYLHRYYGLTVRPVWEEDIVD